MQLKKARKSERMPTHITAASTAFLTLLMFVFTIPWEDNVAISQVGTLSRAVGMAAFGFGVLAIIAIRKTRRYLPIHGLMLIFVYWVMLSLFWSLAPDRTQSRIITYVQLLGMVFLIWEFAPDEGRQCQLMQAFVLGAYVSAMMTIHQYLLVQNSNDLRRLTLRFGAKGSDFNELALYLSLGLPFAWYLSLKSRRFVALWVNRFYIPTAMFAVILTGSRSGFLTLLVAMSFIPIGTLTMHRDVSVLRRIFVFVVILLSLWGVWEYVQDLPPAERLETIHQELRGGDFTRRTDAWSGGIQAWNARPVLGAGAGAFGTVVVPLTNFSSAHSSYVSLLTELGIIGLMVFISIPIMILFSSNSSIRIVKLLWICLFAALATGSAGLSWEYSKGTWFLFGLATAHVHQNLANREILARNYRGHQVPTQPTHYG